MEAVQQIIDSTLLNGVISLPKRFHNKRVEVTVTLKEDRADLPVLTISDIDALLNGSITETLIGILPRTEKSIKDYRA